MAAFATRNLGRERLAISPDGAIFKVFSLPNGHGAFQSINKPTASLKGSGAMGGGDHNGNAGFSDLQAAETVFDCDVAYRKFRKRLLCQKFHLLDRHF